MSTKSTKSTFLRTQLNTLSTPLHPPPHFLNPSRTDTSTPLPPRHVLTALEKLHRLQRTHHSRSYPPSSTRHILSQLTTLYLVPPSASTPDPDLATGHVFHHPNIDIITHLETKAGIRQLPLNLPDLDDLPEEQRERAREGYLNLKTKLERLERVVETQRRKREALGRVKERVLELVEGVEGSEGEMEEEEGRKRIQEDVVGVGGGGWNEELEGIKGEAVRMGAWVAGLEVGSGVQEEVVRRRGPMEVGKELLGSRK